MRALLLNRQLRRKKATLSLRTPNGQGQQSLLHAYCNLIEPGATAFESQGPHVPVGMLRRLNAIAQRTSRRNRHHDDVGIEATANSSDNGTSEGVASTRRYNSNLSMPRQSELQPVAATQKGFGPNTPGSGSGSPGHQHRYQPANGAHDGAGSVRSAHVSTAHGGKYGVVPFQQLVVATNASRSQPCTDLPTRPRG